MKKKINHKKSTLNKNIILFIVILLFLFFICSSFVLLDRKYFIMEKVFKNTNSIINSFIIKNTYNTNLDVDNILKSKINILKEENNELKKSLNLKQVNESYIPALVINHNINTWFDKIEVHTNNSLIKEKDAVVTEDGLIGFISKTSKYVNEVSLITGINEDNMLSVMIKTDNGYISGILKEYDIKKGLFIVSDVISKEEIKKNSEVLLSGYDNLSYKGLKVGNVVKQKTDNYGISRTIWVKSSVSFDNLMVVMIVGEK